MLYKIVKKLDALIFSKDRRDFVENLITLGFANIIAGILPIATIPYLMHTIGPEKYGLIAFAQALIQYFVLLTDYGFNFSANRQISICRNDRERVAMIFNAILMARLILMAGCFLLLLALLLAVPKFGKDPLVYLWSFGAVLGSVLLPVYFFQGMEKMRYIFFANLWSLASLALIVGFVKEEAHYIYVPLFNSVGVLLAGIYALIAIRVKFHVRFFIPPFHEIMDQFRDGWHVFISNMTGAFYNNSRVFILGFFVTSTITGYYAIAEKMIGLLITFPLLLILLAAFPRLCDLYVRKPEMARLRLHQFHWGLVFIYGFLVPLAFVFARPLVYLLCGGATPSEVILCFRILLISLGLTAANVFPLHAFLIVGKPAFFSKINVIYGILGPFVTLLGAYYYSYQGVAVSVVLMSIFGFFLTLNEHKTKEMQGT